MIILALDVSSVSSGWAILDDGKPILDGYGIIHPNPKQSEGARLLYFQNEVARLINRYNPDQIVIEDIFCFNKVSFKVLALYRGVALKTIYEYTGKEAHSMMAVSARSLVGVGIKKEQAFEGIIQKYKLEGSWDFEATNDIVDAYCLGFALIKLMNGKTVSPRQHKKRRKAKRKTTTKRRKKVARK